jgi:hypothetical protein
VRRFNYHLDAAAYGVFFFRTLKPILPAEDHETSPFCIVKDMMMLLKVAEMSFSVDSTITLRFLQLL